MAVNKDKLVESLAVMKDKNKELLAKDKEDAKAKKAAVESSYQQKVSKIDDKIIAEVKKKFQKEYEIEKKRDFIPTGVTKKIDSMLADVYAKEGLDLVEKGDLKSARKYLSKAFYFDSENKNANSGIVTGKPAVLS